jgi:GntR family transcriptional repressor for pyruvate dehydrogenase complex
MAFPTRGQPERAEGSEVGGGNDNMSAPGPVVASEDLFRRPNLRSRRSAVVLARAILDRIKTAGLESGDLLPSEASLAHQYGVGKGLLREAIRILEVHGFVTVTPGAKGGARVAAPGAAEYGDMSTMFFQQAEVRMESLLEARVALEPYVARLAALWQNADGIAQVVQILEETRSLDVNNDQLYMTCSQRFHQVVARVSGNPVLDLYVESLTQIWAARVPGPFNPRSRRRQIIVDHIGIAEAIIAADPERAEHLMREHMHKFAKQARAMHTQLMGEILDWR